MRQDSESGKSYTCDEVLNVLLVKIAFSRQLSLLGLEGSNGNFLCCVAFVGEQVD
jgi:hypothetical protein